MRLLWPILVAPVKLVHQLGRVNPNRTASVICFPTTTTTTWPIQVWRIKVIFTLAVIEFSIGHFRLVNLFARLSTPIVAHFAFVAMVEKILSPIFLVGRGPSGGGGGTLGGRLSKISIRLTICLTEVVLFAIFDQISIPLTVHFADTSCFLFTTEAIVVRRLDRNSGHKSVHRTGRTERKLHPSWWLVIAPLAAPITILVITKHPGGGTVHTMTAAIVIRAMSHFRQIRSTQN